MKFLSTSWYVVNIALAEFNSIIGFPTCGMKHKPSSTYWPKDFLEAITNEWTTSHCNSTFFLHLRLCIGFKHQLFFFFCRGESNRKISSLDLVFLWVMLDPQAFMLGVLTSIAKHYDHTQFLSTEYLWRLTNNWPRHYHGMHQGLTLCLWTKDWSLLLSSSSNKCL